MALRLQGCFEDTNWNNLIALSSNINEQVHTVLSYIFCVDNIIPSIKVTIFPNNKPWVTVELKEIVN